jgi:hypothetical protein
MALESTQPPIQYVLEVFPLEVEWLGCETDFSLPPNKEFKNEWRYISSPLYALMTCKGTSFALHYSSYSQVAVFQSSLLSEESDLI